MSAENVELMRGAYADAAGGNFWALAPLLHEEVVMKQSKKKASLTGGARVYRGSRGLEKAARDWFEAWEWFAIDGEEFIDAGENVVVVSRYRALPRHGGAEVDMRMVDVWTLRDGKVVLYRSFDEREEALEAVGLAE